MSIMQTVVTGVYMLRCQHPYHPLCFVTTYKFAGQSLFHGCEEPLKDALKLLAPREANMDEHVGTEKDPMEGIFGSPVDEIAHSQAGSSRKPNIDSMCGGYGDKNASRKQAGEDTPDQQKAKKRAEKRAHIVGAQGEASKESAEVPLKPELAMNKDVEDAEKSSEKPIEKDTTVNLYDEDTDLLISDVCGEILGRRKKRSNTKERTTAKKKAKVASEPLEPTPGGYTLEEEVGNIFLYWTRSIARRFWEVHGRDGQSLELQHSLDYKGMHRVTDEEDSDDTVEDLDGAADYLSDRREEELDIFLRLVAIAVIQHAIVTRRRLVFDPLGKACVESRVQSGGLQALVETTQRAEKRFGVSHGKASKMSSKDKRKSRAEEIGSKRVIVSVLEVSMEFFEMALVKFSHGIGIQNSGHGLAVGVRTAESKMQTKERWGNVMGEKCLKILSSGDNHFQDIIASSADVITKRT
ncbi:hypothetical protein L7F22_049140 [Adiantum nelumboides]|nr:hypothetical protein [Adiantum nelumboides]